MYICTPKWDYCGRGGIGRHARLRIWCRKVWEFESPRPHLKAVILLLFFISNFIQINFSFFLFANLEVC